MRNPAEEDAERACAYGDCEQAIGLFERAVGLEPYDFRLHYRLGMCYGGCCRLHALVHPDMAVAYLRPALRLVGATPGRARAAIADQLGDTLCHGGTAPRAAALRTAVACHAEAAEIYQSLGMADDWGRTQFNLGNSCCELSEITGESHWQEAVFHYEESLRVRTREKDPERHAAVLENLGSAYHRLSDHGTGGNVRKSIECYRRALRIYAPATQADKIAALENNLGNAYLSLPQTDEKTKARNARRAIRHFDRALSFRCRDRSRRAYGITEYNRAQAHYRLAQTLPDGNPTVAVTGLEEAFAAFQSCGEQGYTQLVRAQLERICRQQECLREESICEKR